MSSLLNKLFKKGTQCEVAIVQYERDDYSVGHEEQLHWAVVAVVSKDESEIKAAVWQIMDRHYSDGRPSEWSLSHVPTMPLNKTMKCLGGVIIGVMERKDIDSANKLIHDLAQPKPKFPGWNCRDWVVEVIKDILSPRGWADARITTQHSLLPSLRLASQASANARQQHKRSLPHLVALELPA